MRAGWSFLCLAALGLLGFGDSFPPPKTLGPAETYGRKIQRTMTLLATSTPRERHTVKVLFYGQSITEQKWARLVADDLRRRFPYANLIVENRAIGGHSSPRLVKTAEADLYPFYPDLLIFHVYGSQVEYEEIIRRTRERTTAEILIQNDHLRATDALVEEAGPAGLGPRKEVWSQFMNSVFLPGVAARYGAELADQRALWKQYLRDYDLAPQALLKDNVHLNARGDYLMAEIIKAHLRYDPSFPREGWEKLSQTWRVGRDVKWERGRLGFEFEGNRVDLIAGAGGGAPARVLIDGRPPSRFPELYGVTRASAYPGSSWPCLLRVGSEKPLALEEWTLTVKEISDDHKQVKFEVSGSRTGPDGAGTSEARFVSNSGRVVIEPGDWNLEYSRQVFKRPVAPGFEITWRVEARFADEFVAPAAGEPGIERVVTVAQGLAPGRHRLEISGAGAPIEALRTYRPPAF